jgi:hypothetical protein
VLSGIGAYRIGPQHEEVEDEDEQVEDEKVERYA